MDEFKDTLLFSNAFRFHLFNNINKWIHLINGSGFDVSNGHEVSGNGRVLGKPLEDNVSIYSDGSICCNYSQTKEMEESGGRGRSASEEEFAKAAMLLLETRNGKLDQVVSTLREQIHIRQRFAKMKTIKDEMKVSANNLAALLDEVVNAKRIGIELEREAEVEEISKRIEELEDNQEIWEVGQ